MKYVLVCGRREDLTKYAIQWGEPGDATSIENAIGFLFHNHGGKIIYGRIGYATEIAGITEEMAREALEAGQRVVIGKQAANMERGTLYEVYAGVFPY